MKKPPWIRSEAYGNPLKSMKESRLVGKSKFEEKQGDADSNKG